MRKLNTNKMLKNIARNTPDRKVVRFDTIRENSHEIYRYEGYQFERMMFLKHGERNVRVQIYLDNDLARYPGEAVYTMIARSSNGSGCMDKP